MNNKSYSKGKSNPNFIIKNILISNFILIILFMFILSSISVFAATNVSILYAWNGSSNVPIQVDGAGRLKTTLNLSKSTGITPEIDNLYDLGTTGLRWKSLYVFDIIAAGSISVSGSINATSINITGNAYFATSSGNVGIGNTIPNVTLDVSGNANVSGILHASGVNVSGNVEAAFFIGDGSLLSGLITGHPWNSSGTNVYLNDSSALVGIGTVSPDNILTIIGNEITANAILHINASDNFNDSVINVITLDHILKSANSTNGTGVSILFRATDNISQIEELANISAILYAAVNGSELSALTFSTRGADIGDGAGHLTERLRIDGYGRVGINTSSPTSALHVIGDVNISRILYAGSINVTNNVEAAFFVGDGSLLAGISGAGVWNSSGTNIYLNDSSALVGIGTISPSAKLHVNGSVIIEENLSVVAIEILSNFSYKLLGGCYEDTSITITDDSTFCDTSQPFNVTSVYYNGSWRVQCCVPQRMCFKDTTVTVTDSSTVCNKDSKNYSVTSIFYNSDGNWQAKCCNNAGSCFEDKLITPADPLTICDTEGNSDIVTVGYSTTWEVTCCEGMIR